MIRSTTAVIRMRTLHHLNCRLVHSTITTASAGTTATTTAAAADWRKSQLDQLEQKFNTTTSTPSVIDRDEDVQPMWKDMESRVTKRKSLTMEERTRKQQPIGRRNIRPTDEDAWLDAGLYDK